jgi:pimeloyl-ACP methyl ester carboxylesterase
MARFLELLGRHADVIALSHPGFGHSARPADFETVYDLVHLYLALLEAKWAPDFNTMTDDEIIARAELEDSVSLRFDHFV